MPQVKEVSLVASIYKLINDNLASEVQFIKSIVFNLVFILTKYFWLAVYILIYVDDKVIYQQ